MTRSRTGMSVWVVGMAGVVFALLSPVPAFAQGPTSTPTTPVTAETAATQAPDTTSPPSAIPSATPTTPEPPATVAEVPETTSEAVPTAVPAGSGGAGAPTASSDIELEAAAGTVGLALVAAGAIGLRRRARRS